MVQAGIGGLDTPRTNLGDATYLTNQLDFDISQEQSFQSPSKDNNNLVQQLQNGRRGATSLKTPRSRVALSERRNLPAGLGGGEFTPLLKSATRNSALRIGKENIPQTPAFLRPGGLDNIQEDVTPLPMNSSAYADSRNGSYMAGTPLPQMDSSTADSTPMALLPRRNEGPGVLQDGNQLSLREQENVIDKIEKENFGLKLKIHFLEEALRKAGPGFSEATLKENTELKVDKVTMQRELLRYKKTLSTAERDVEVYRQSFLEMQEKVKQKHADQGQREELERLRQALEEKEDELDRVKNQGSQVEDLQDKIHDLEVEAREKERLLEDQEDEVENLKEEAEKREKEVVDLELQLKKARREAVELEEKAQVSEELDDAKETIQELEQELRRMKSEVEDAQEEREDAVKGRERAEANLEELQDEMANKSITTKGLGRQIEEKAHRLQDELEDLKEKHSDLENNYERSMMDLKSLQLKLDRLDQDSRAQEQKLKDRLQTIQDEKDASVRDRDVALKRLESTEKELQQSADEKNILQLRHDTLTKESATLQRDLARSQKEVDDLQDQLAHEKTLALNSEREVRDEYKAEIERLNDDVEDMKAELRQKERLYDDDNDKWDDERKKLESQRDLAEEKASGLKRTIERLEEAEGTLSGKEMALQRAVQSEKDRHESQEALLNRQINELNEDLQTRRTALDQVKSELSQVREELRLSQREQKSLAEKVEGLEDEVEILQTSLDDESEQANQEISAARQEIDSLRRQLQGAKQDLAKAEAASIDARAEIEAFQGNVEAGNSSKEQLQSRLRDVESQLSRSRQEKQALQDQLDSVKFGSSSLRASKADLEAELDEVKRQLNEMKQQGEETFRIDQERMDLRTTKMKLDGEVRRLREENKIAISTQQSLEEDLQKEIDRAAAVEARLGTEIHDLQRILRGSSEKRELAAAKKSIQLLEEKISDLENQLASGENQHDISNENSIIRRDLQSARQKESEYLQREAAQKDVLRTLKRQITDLERRAHDAEISRLVSSSPHSSINSSARKSELTEVRAQLASAHQTLKDLRSQLKEAEKDSARKLNALNLDLEARSTAWETQKDELEQALDAANFSKQELTAKNTAAEATVSRLRSKIDRLEKALNAERLNSSEDRTIVLERRDLHEMLRETQLQAESLEIVVQERESTIAAISASESSLRAKLQRVRDERALHRSKVGSLQEQLEDLQRKYIKAKESWEEEKRNLTRGVRFANMSLSVNESTEMLGLKKEFDEREKKHVKELRGMNMQLDWLRARVRREEGFRASAAYAKKFMGLQIDLFEAWYVVPFISLSHPL